MTDNVIVRLWNFLKKNVDWLLFSELVLYCFALSLRFYHTLIKHPLYNYIYSDARNYYENADKLLHGLTGYYHVFSQPGYTIFLFYLSRFFGDVGYGVVIIAVLQSLLSVISIWIMYRISKKILKPAYALLYLAVMVVYFPLISYSGFLMTETFGFVLITLYFWIFVSSLDEVKKLYMLSILSFLAMLFRPTLLLAILVCVAYLLRLVFLKRKLSLRSILVLLFGFVGSCLIALFLNFQASNRWILMPLNGGLNFAQGACYVKEYKDSNGWGFASPSHVQRGFTGTWWFDKPFYNSSAFYQIGIGCFMYKPLNVIKKFSEPYYLFFDNLPWPGSDNSDEKKVLVAFQDLFNLLVVPGLILSILLVADKKKREILIKLWIFPLSLFISTIIYYGDVRYRVPYDGVLILIAFWVYSQLWINKNKK